MTKETGGSAYPQNTVYMAPNGQVMQQGPQGGMTLRDYFAAKALVGYLQASAQNGWAEANQYQATQAARNAYLVADAMLEERS